MVENIIEKLMEDERDDIISFLENRIDFHEYLASKNPEFSYQMFVNEKNKKAVIETEDATYYIELDERVDVKDEFIEPIKRLDEAFFKLGFSSNTLEDWLDRFVKKYTKIR